MFKITPLKKVKAKSNLANVLWAVAERGIQVVLTMVITGIIARYFGVELFGSYQFSMSVLFVATALTWLCPAEIFYSKIDDSGRLNISIITTSVVYRLIISAVVYLSVLIYTFTYIDDTSQQAFILILSASIIYSEPLGIFRFLLECQGYYYITSRIRIVALLVKVLSVIALVFVQAEPIFIILPLILESLIIGVICLLMYRSIDRSCVFQFKTFDKKMAASFLREGGAFWVGLVSMNAFMKLDRFYLESRLNNIDFGHYAAAISAFEQYTALATMLLGVLGPVMIYRAMPEKLHKNTLMMVVLFLLAGVIGALILFFASYYLITLLYGHDYKASVPIFKLIIIFGPLVFVDIALSSFIIRNKAATFFSIKWLSALLVAYIVNVFTFPYIGWQAGVYGYASGWLTALLFSIIFFMFYRNAQEGKDVR